MNRTIGGIPLIYWIGALGLGIGAFAWIKKKSSGSSAPATGAAAKTPSFTQAQEVQDFQIFSALTGAQQASDLNFLTEVAGLFSGGSSTGTTGGAATGSGGGGTGGSAVPSPPSTGTTAPATVPASTTPSASPQASTASAPAASAPAGDTAGTPLGGFGPGLGRRETTAGAIPGSYTYNGVTMYQ